MLVLLPPSETKRLGGSGSLQLRSLAFDAELHTARAAVIAALEELSRDVDAAASALKLGVKNRGEVLLNRELESAGVLPAVERYTGVLYDALDVAGFSDAVRDWIGDHVAVQSALFGLVHAEDHIPAYRLSAGTRLPALGSSLQKIWRDAHARVDWCAAGFVLDLRSKSYAGLAPVPGAFGLQVSQQSGDGELRALNHFNKAAKGMLVRKLAEHRADVRSPRELSEWAESVDLDLRYDAESNELTLVTDLGAPVSPGALYNVQVPIKEKR